MTRTPTMRKLTRLQTLFTGGAFALAAILGPQAPSLAADATPTTDQAAAVVEQVTQATQPTTAPSAEELHPLPITAEQKRFTPTKEQLANAKAIVDTAKEMGLPPRAWTIAVATSLQETNLKNLGHLGERNDHDSQGLFQQRPSTGWGTVDQITDPHYATRAFFEGTKNNRGLLDIDGWDKLPLTQAAQKVQVSAYPNHYAKHEAQAGDIINALHGTGPYADLAADLRY
jgi:hypothetical protein